MHCCALSHTAEGLRNYMQPLLMHAGAHAAMTGIHPLMQQHQHAGTRAQRCSLVHLPPALHVARGRDDELGHAEPAPEALVPRHVSAQGSSWLVINMSQLPLVASIVYCIQAANNRRDSTGGKRACLIVRGGPAAAHKQRAVQLCEPSGDATRQVTGSAMLHSIAHRHVLQTASKRHKS